MINAVVINRKVYVFEAEDVDVLRRQHRIVGSLVGCLSRAPRQNKQHGLPLLLMPEEATMLAEKGIVRLVWYDRLQGEPTKEEIEEFNILREKSFLEQTALHNEERKRQLLEMADHIEEGKKKKKRKQQSKEMRNIKDANSVEEKLENVTEVQDVTNRDAMMVQLFIGCPWLNRKNVIPANWNYPSNEEESLRVKVYTDLWEKGCYITAGGKFGGDYLLYPGDPTQYHASHIAICTPLHSSLSGFDLIAKGRLGTTVKKLVVLCSPTENGNGIKYLTIKWTGMS